MPTSLHNYVRIFEKFGEVKHVQNSSLMTQIHKTTNLAVTKDASLVTSHKTFALILALGNTKYLKHMQT